jgi:hypothetical protein
MKLNCQLIFVYPQYFCLKVLCFSYSVTPCLLRGEVVHITLHMYMSTFTLPWLRQIYKKCHLPALLHS